MSYTYRWPGTEDTYVVDLVEGATATYNIATDWISIEFPQQPAAELRRALGRRGAGFGFKYGRWRAPWSVQREDLARAIAGGVESIDQDPDDEGRAERYDEHSDNAGARADAAFEGARQAVAGIPFGQPILRGHHSEAGHRAAIRRSHQRMERGAAEVDRSEHWRGRAASARRRSAKREDPHFLRRKVEQHKASARRARRNAEGRSAGHYLRVAEHYEALAEYWQGRLDELGSPAPPEAAVGDLVQWRGRWGRVLRVNPKTYSVRELAPWLRDYEGRGWSGKYPRMEVAARRPGEDLEAVLEEMSRGRKAAQ